MPRRRWQDIREHRRKDLEAISHSANWLLKAADELPTAVLIGWQVWKYLGKFASTEIGFFDKTGWDAWQPGGNEGQWKPQSDAWGEVIAKVNVVSTPIFTVLGGMYQGGIGALSLGLTSALSSVGAASLMTRRYRKYVADNGAHRVELWWTLDWPDALMLASFLPLILRTLRAQGIEKSGVISDVTG